MSSTFVNEVQSYAILERYRLSPAPHIFIDALDNFDSTPFNDGQQVVYKAVVNDVWHKSDLGLLSFGTFSSQNLSQTYKKMYDLNPKKEDWQGLLICEKVSSVDSALPCDLLLSVKQDASCGPVVTLGFGGIQTELWGKELKEGVLNFVIELTTIDEAVAQLSDHLLGKILLGMVRHGQACTSLQKLKSLLKSAWQLAANLQKEGLALIEINPLVIDKDGDFIVLDAVAERACRDKDRSKTSARAAIPAAAQQVVFNPQSFVIAGVSSKKKAFGNIILDNLKESDIAPENITVLKPGSDSFEGYQTISALTEISQPVDALILAVPAVDAIALIKETFQLQKAKIIHLVAGGIGDGADHSRLKEQLRAIIDSYSSENRPYIVGPNSLGMLLAPQKINTLFIPHNKLPLSYYPLGNIGLLAQSGAFFITRISKNPQLPIRIGLCIGNQLDLSATDLLTGLAADDKIKVIGLYLEGAPQGNALALAKAIKNIAHTKKVIIYRAGRSTAGMKAAAGHTGALASDYSIEKKLLQTAGAIICESFAHFENSLKWYSVYPHFKAQQQGISVISNAGYESVAAADGFGQCLILLSESTKKELTKSLTQHKLAGIVTAANPLDITPMASENVYFDCCRIMLQAAESQMLILGLVPLTPMIETGDQQIMNKHAARIKELAVASKKPIAIVIDAGNDYLKLQGAFTGQGFPVFDSIQDLFKIIT